MSALRPLWSITRAAVNRAPAGARAGRGRASTSVRAPPGRRVPSSLPSMPTTSNDPDRDVAGTSVDRRLFRALVDDAAVFPPGNAPLQRAAEEHRELRRRPWADLIGPLLVPAAQVLDLVGLTTFAGRVSTPLPVVVIARPGTPADQVAGAIDGAAGTAVLVAGAELGIDADWPALTGRGLPLAVEVPRGAALAPALDRVADAARRGALVQAKFRTGPTPTWPWPDEGELAGVLRGAVDRDLPVKLTGGLHHLARGAYVPSVGAPPEEQHGLLNVLLAVRSALGGAPVAELESVLAQRDPAVLAAAVRALTTIDVAAVRATFTAYGCCGVTDPITELLALHLIEENPT